MTEKDFCVAIKLNSAVLKYASKKLVPETILQELTDIHTAPSAYQRINETFGNDDKGLKTLACMLQASRYTYDKYKKLGISDEIFIDTLSCFTRFVEEYKDSYGEYGFDRGWWTYRQLSCVLFKIGELEYEYRADEKTVHLHISSRAHIDIDNCKYSLDMFKGFTAKHFPDKSYPIVCNSWLLSPELDKLLGRDSHILAFKRCFDITDWDKTNNEFLQWIYGRTDINYNDLPEKTSLQKNVKNHIINGGFVGSAYGALRDFI